MGGGWKRSGGSPGGKGRGSSPERSAAGGPSYRLFLAVELPGEVTEELVSWQDQFLKADRALRMTPEGQIHITLVFLGQMGDRERELAEAQLEALNERTALNLTATGLVGLPKGRSPRVIAAEIEDREGRIQAMQGALAAGLVEKRLYKKEKHPYFPHVTVARARGRPVVNLLDMHPGPVQFTAVRVTLYNSILKPDGAVHRPLKTVELN